MVELYPRPAGRRYIDRGEGCRVSFRVGVNSTGGYENIVEQFEPSRN